MTTMLSTSAPSEAAEITALRTFRATLQSLKTMTEGLADDLEHAAGSYAAFADVSGQLEKVLAGKDARDGESDAKMGGISHQSSTGDAHDRVLDLEVLPPLQALLEHISHLLRFPPTSIQEVLYLTTALLTQIADIFAAPGNSTAELTRPPLAHRVRPLGLVANFLVTIFLAKLIPCGRLVRKYDTTSNTR